ncbi:integrase [Caldovatus sediminis]|uniref:Integrase n=1 Tax=Caldovatus sediminis TaxID=2041189 RepID=A0A8J2ZFE2_9PROT|nr:site-specific integrase [Caldovatus sediminis]GGG52610.1 integrase [Caldovatus sediminis]
MARVRRRIGLREVRALPPGGEIYDSAVPGFGARRQKGAAVSYFVLYRTREGRSRRYTIGKHGAPWTPEQAREQALAILAAARVEGGDPAAEKREKRQAATVADLCDLYLADAEAGRLLTRRGVAKKASTLATDRSRIERHIKPLLGAMKVPAVTRADVERFMHDVAEGGTARRVKLAKKRALSNVRGGKGAASRTVGLLGAIFAYAERKRMIPGNPVRGVIRFADGKRERRLSDAEYAALGRGLALAEEARMWPAAVAAARFLALTGWRSGEALTLRWGMVDLARRTARLPDTKTGESLRPLSAAACDVLRAQGPGAADALVFPPSRGDGTMSGFPSLFARIAKAGGLPADVTPHVLRHSFASLANDLGYSEATIGMLIGHKGAGGTTRGYIHHGDALTVAADRIAATILRKLAGEGAAAVVEGPGAQRTAG